LENVFHSLEAFHLGEKKIQQFTHGDCEFGYRDSIFKNKYRNQFAILSVTFRLRKRPVFHTSYGAIKEELSRRGVQDLSIRAIAQAVINIRTSKLPDPNIIPNAGSFFKNPEISASKHEELLVKFPGIIAYPGKGEKVKLAAGWLIEKCGPNETISWRGYRVGDAGCHARQALVLVNYGKATGKEVLDLGDAIAASVKNKFSVVLEREVNAI
jgi:UDP-N-acetylmuramate dehydrogenase